MAIMPQIAMGFQMPQIQLPNQGNMLMQISQIQSAQQANALRQSQMQKMQMDAERENQLAQMLMGGGEATLPQFVQAGGPTRGIEVFEAMQKQRGAQQKATAGRQLTTAQVLASLKGDFSDEALGYASQMLSQQGQRDPFIAELMLTPPQGRPLLASRIMNAVPGMSEYIMGRREQEEKLRKTSAETAKLLAEERNVGKNKPFAPTDLSRLLSEQKQFAPGTPEHQAYQNAINSYQRGVTIETPVPIVDPRTGQVVYTTRQEAIGKTPPQFQEGLTPRERQQREAKLPAAKSAVTAFNQKTSKLDGLIEELINHPGLNQITGLIGGRIIGITDEGRAAEALYNTILAQGGFSELQAMRDASTSGGALGSVSNQENQFLRDAFGVVARTQSTPDLVRGLKGVQSTLRSSQSRIRDAFADTYAYRGDEPAAAPQQQPAAAPQQQPAAAPGAPAPPRVGEVRQGYRFQGGDPADRNSWKKVD